MALDCPDGQPGLTAGGVNSEPNFGLDIPYGLRPPLLTARFSQVTFLAPSRLFALFVLGAVLSPIGDHIHVATGTTTYFDAGPQIWDSPWWFPVLVGIGTVAIAEIRVRLGSLRVGISPRWAVGGLAAVMTTYALTGLLCGYPNALGVVLIGGIALIVWLVIGDLRGAWCGVLAAVFGTTVEVIMAATGLFEYNSVSDSLFGVALWLPALYFTFGVAVAVLAELLAEDGLPMEAGPVGTTP